MSESRMRVRCLVGFTAAVVLVPCAAWPAPDLSIGKQVTPQQPASGQPVEFEITVRNAGDTDALDVQVVERLPPGLEIPDGTAAFVSQGFYDPGTGNWSVGDLVAGAAAVMTLPAQKNGSVSSPCLVNTASVEPHAGDTVVSNDSAAAGVREAGVERCVDLHLDNLLFSVPQPICTNLSSATMTLWVRNLGPDAARGASVRFAHTPLRLPDFRFYDSDCTGAQMTHCELGTIEAGGLRVLDVVSEEFTNDRAYDVTLQVTLASADADYAASGNQTSVTRSVPVLANSDCGLPDVGIGIGSPSCFIATAAWGTPAHAAVVTLREFRDRRLLTNAVGRRFVSIYYRISPPLASFIAARPAARAAVRAALLPIVLAIRHPELAGMGVVVWLFALMGLPRWRRQRVV